MCGVADRESGLIKYFADSKKFSLINFVGSKEIGNADFKLQDILSLISLNTQELNMCKKI